MQVTLLQDPSQDSQIVFSGAYYIQSHLAKTDGGLPEYGH